MTAFMSEISVRTDISRRLPRLVLTSPLCKSNPSYYLEITSRLNVAPEECLMVGNDVTEDMAAKSAGMEVFLLTDCLINREGKDIAQYRHGDFDRLLGFLREEK